jgi:circadian clock protein KaiC
MERIRTYIPNLDDVLNGGIPKYSINIIAGTPGTGKTILAQQMIFNNARDGKKSIFLTTVSEPSVKVVRYQKEFDFFDADELGRSVIYSDLGEVIRRNGTKGALEVMTQLVNEHSPDILVIDSFKALHDLSPSPVDFRKFLFEVAVKLSSLNTTAFLLGEYTLTDEEDMPEFAVADSVMYLTYKDGKRKLEIKKMRGTDFLAGKHSVKITSHGMTVYPHLKPKVRSLEIPSEKGSITRVLTGIPGLDTMLEGGLLKKRAVLVTGSAGTGKTMLGLQFLAEGARSGESGIMLSLEENVDEIVENAKSYGLDIGEFINNGMLTVMHVVPVELCVDEMICNLKQVIEEKKPKRIVVDGISNIERNLASAEIRDILYTLVDIFKENEITSILTSEVSKIIGGAETTEHGTSFIVDAIISLRYVEIESEMKKAVSIVKMRGSKHNREICEYRITDEGILVELPFTAYNGVFSGAPSKPPQEAFVEAFKKKS